MASEIPSVANKLQVCGACGARPLRSLTVPETRGGGEIVKTRLQQSSGRTVVINYLVRGGKVIDVYLNGTISDLATRRYEFASLIAAGGADGLVKRLHERTQTLLSR
jgi:phospholipid transport system substrate-binding protein